MKNVSARKKRIFALAAAGCLCASLAAAPAAYGLYYVHGEDHVADSSGDGVIEVVCTVDTTAQGGDVRTGLIFVPAGSTAADCLQEMVVSDEDKSSVEALHDYGYEPLTGLLDGVEWTCEVYRAGSQEPGTHATFDASAEQGDQTALERFDNVVFTAA